MYTHTAQIHGDTIHSLAGLWSKLSNAMKHGKVNWKLTKLLFIDEISMLDKKDFLKLDKYLRPFFGSILS